MADNTNSSVGDDDIALGDLTSDKREPDKTDDPESVLASFRQEWHNELVGRGSVNPSPVRGNLRTTSPGSPNLKGSLGPLTTPVKRTAEKKKAEVGESVVHSLANENDGVGGSILGVVGGGGSGGSGGGGRRGGEEEVKPDVEQKAIELFNKAVELEQSGQLYEAIQFYRRAMTLVPDIEFRAHRRSMLERNEVHQVTVLGSEAMSEDEDLEDEELEDLDLIMRFQYLLAPVQATCQPQFQQEACHISSVPPEILERILCWVVSSDLDMRSLEQVAQVCRGFYLAARNPSIWHKACLRVWGISSNVTGGYGSWRKMFIEKPHPRYNGCYISRTTYFRSGESSFQDQNYQPWHEVHYFRYFRFFTDGTVTMLTTADEPRVAVTQLHSREQRTSQGIQGHFRIHGSNVSLVLKRYSRDRLLSNRRKNRRRKGGTTDVAETVFQIEFEIRSARSRPHWILAWQNYSIISVYHDDKQNISQVDINDTSKFPALAFSRVKSYHQESEMLLY